MCEKEYAMRAKKKNVYHMGLVTRVGAEKSLSEVTDRKFRQHYPVPPNKVDRVFESAVKMYHNSIYIAGKKEYIFFYQQNLYWAVINLYRLQNVIVRFFYCISFSLAFHFL